MYLPYELCPENGLVHNFISALCPKNGLVHNFIYFCKLYFAIRTLIQSYGDLIRTLNLEIILIRRVTKILYNLSVVYIRILYILIHSYFVEKIFYKPKVSP